jgi:hypothetical protein
MRLNISPYSGWFRRRFPALTPDEKLLTALKQIIDTSKKVF